MNESKKLTIRIKFRSQQDNLAGDEGLPSYHWGRIIGVSLTLIVAITLFIGGVSYYLNQDNLADKYEKSPSTSVPPASAGEIASTLTAETEAPVTTPAFSDEFTEQSAAAKGKEKSTIPLDEEEIVAPQSDVYSALDVYSTLSSAAKAPHASAESENKNITQTGKKEGATSPISNTVPAPQFRQSKIDIFSDHIKRFVIASAVTSNEPVGTISDIHFDANKIATVYAYSDVSELQDKTIYYQWILNGKNIAKVRVDVGSNRWRSYSSKLIQAQMHGQWKVELQNEDGENLASIQFIY
ncbi:MAG TPA: DUF2914 domain-containing protein [Psychromonas sp.]